MVEKNSNATVIDCTKKNKVTNIKFLQLITVELKVLLRIFNPGAHDLEMKLEISCIPIPKCIN